MSQAADVFFACDHHMSLVAYKYYTELAWIGNPPSLCFDAVRARSLDVYAQLCGIRRYPLRLAAGKRDLGASSGTVFDRDETRFRRGRLVGTDSQGGRKQKEC